MRVRTNSAYSVCVRAGGKLLTSGSNKTLRRGDVRESCVRPKAPLSEGAPAGCDGARGVAPADARLSAFLLPVAEPSLRAVLVRPVILRAVRGADIVVARGCFLALGVVSPWRLAGARLLRGAIFGCLRAQLDLALRAAGQVKRACENGSRGVQEVSGGLLSSLD